MEEVHNKKRTDAAESNLSDSSDIESEQLISISISISAKHQEAEHRWTSVKSGKSKVCSSAWKWFAESIVSGMHHGTCLIETTKVYPVMRQFGLALQPPCFGDT
jgi:hypothetical protein